MGTPKEYIVTLKDRYNLDAFYQDMETASLTETCEHIPNREVLCSDRRPISRNTHYMLTAEEAEALKNDERVLAVEINPAEINIFPKPLAWSKNPSLESNDANWGLLRCYEGNQRSNWGIDGTSTINGTLNITSKGKNVDVVIVDGHIHPDHPEYSIRSEGYVTDGGFVSRVVQYNWLTHSSVPGDYTYTPYVNESDSEATADNDHGAHVAGIVAGNSHGWARLANIYNISPYSTNPNGILSTSVIDYVRSFHLNKSINPETGRTNPTIMNNSWGYSIPIAISDILQISYRGNIFNGPFTSAQLTSYGLRNSNGYATIVFRNSAIDADIQDAINDGIIVVGAAGNESTRIDVSTGADYNNIVGFLYESSTYGMYYHRGSTPGAASNVVCVGSIGVNKVEIKSSFSNTGPRVDVYAPGSLIMSSVNSEAVLDLRTFHSNLADKKYMNKLSGTSMASPQVCGILACALEIYPNMNQAGALEYLLRYSKVDQINDTKGTYSDNSSLQGSPNRYLAYYKEREDSGKLSPKQNVSYRPTSGVVFPRTRLRKKG